MKTIFLLTATAAIAFGQGSLTPPGSPAPTMKSLQDIWDRLGDLQDRVDIVQANQSSTEALVLDLARASGSTVSYVWRTQTVDSDGLVGFSPTLAFPAPGRPAVGYADYTTLSLKHAAFDGSGWAITVVEPERPGFLSQAVSPAGSPAISYTLNSGVHYAEPGSAGWTVDTVAGFTNTEMQGTSLAFSPQGEPAIAYFLAVPEHLVFATRSGGTWNSGTVTTGIGPPRENTCSLGFTPDGLPMIAYTKDAVTSPDSEVLLAAFDGSAWSFTTIEATAMPGSTRVSLAISPSGHPAVAYTDDDGSLQLAEFDGSTWSASTAAAHGAYGSLAFSPAGRPAIAYVIDTTYDLAYTERFGSTWTTTIVDDVGQTGLDPSLAFSPSGRPAIAYTDFSNTALKYAEVVAVTISGP